MDAKKLTEFLRNRRDIVKNVDVLVEYHDPTLGMQQTTEHLEVIDFNALLNAIDEFTEELKPDKSDDCREDMPVMTDAEFDQHLRDNPHIPHPRRKKL